MVTLLEVMYERKCDNADQCAEKEDGNELRVKENHGRTWFISFEYGVREEGGKSVHLSHHVTLFVDGCRAISTTVSLPVEKAGANGRG